MRQTTQMIRASQDQQIASTPITLGGNRLNEQVCHYTGADTWVIDAMIGVRLCQGLLGKRLS